MKYLNRQDFLRRAKRSRMRYLDLYSIMSDIEKLDWYLYYNLMQLDTQNLTTLLQSDLALPDFCAQLRKDLGLRPKVKNAT